MGSRAAALIAGLMLVVSGQTADAAPKLTEVYELGGPRQTSIQVACGSNGHVQDAEAEILPAGSGVVVSSIVTGPALKVVTVNADDSQAVGNARWNISATIQCG